MLVRHLSAIVKWQMLKLITLTLALSPLGEGTFAIVSVRGWLKRCLEGG